MPSRRRADACGSRMSVAVAGQLGEDRAGRFTTADIAVVVGSFAISRLLLITVGYLVLATHHSAFHANPLLPDLFVRWDSGWYISTAQSGYSTAQDPLAPGQTNFAFYPFYPLLMWLLSAATGLSLAWAGVLISNACFLAALFVIFALAEKWSGDKAVAGLTVALLCAVPEGFIFSAVYTESLFVLLTSTSMLLFERKQNFAAGVCAALSSATRSTGVFIIVYLGLTLLRERGWRGALMFWKEPERYLPIVMAPVGLFAFWWFSMLATGDAFAQKATIALGWGWQTDWPWTNIVNALQAVTLRDQFLMVSSLVMFGFSLTLLRRTSWILFAYCLVNFLLFWTGTTPNSLLRYSVALFPIFFGLARLIGNRPVVAGALLAAFATVNAVLMGLWALGSYVVL